MTNWTCRDGGRCGIGGYCDDCWNIEKYSEKDLIGEKLELLDKVFKHICEMADQSCDDDATAALIMAASYVNDLKSEIEA